jgi:hypothetical protein
VRDATHILDGLLYHETDLRIEEPFPHVNSPGRDLCGSASL